MKTFTGCVVIWTLSVLIGRGHGWAPGSVATCPPGDPPACPTSPGSDYDNMFNHPTDCNYYVHCDAGRQPICVQCPSGLYFSPSLHVCDWPATAGCVPGGTGTTTTTTTTTTTEPTTTTTEATTTTTEATTTTTTEATTTTTTEATTTTTTEATTTTKRPPPPPPPPPPPSDDGCPMRTTTPTCEECPPKYEEDCPQCACPDDRLPHPFDCRWYYQCVDGAPQATKCDGGWLFDAQTRACVCAECSAECVLKTPPDYCSN